MNDLLFAVEESLSPRLRWMREHGVTVIDNGPNVKSGDENGGWKEWRFCAFQGPDHEDGLYCHDSTGYGDTEDEALTALAKKLNIKLWNEV